jgi:hypothetical protein
MMMAIAIAHSGALNDIISIVPNGIVIIGILDKEDPSPSRVPRKGTSNDWPYQAS